MNDAEKPVVGWREWVALPELGIPALKAKLDTGARTSALHAAEIALFEEEGRERVQFRLHPLRTRPNLLLTCTADVVGHRRVRNSGGDSVIRLVIRTALTLGERTWPIELTLARRDRMLFPMLLGRTALLDRLLLDPACSYTTGRGFARRYPRRSRPD